MTCIRSLFGCLRPSHTADLALKSKHQHPLAKSIASESDSDDLLVNEGTNYQENLWELVVQQKISTIQKCPPQIDANGKDSATPEAFLQTLTALYNKNGFAPRVPRLREIFMGVEPFISAVNTMAASNSVATLVWGGLTLIFQCVLRYVNLFDDTSNMLLDLSNSLPRFRAYAEIFHTPQLHKALRDVYEGYVDFCFRTVEVLQSNTCSAMMRGKWHTLGTEFERTKMWLDSAGAHFEKEARLADVQEQTKRHLEVITKIGSISAPCGSVPLYREPITNLALPRNDRFRGRISVLTHLHAELTPSFQDDTISARVRCSCVIHAIGGMGKTETALEYSYMYRHCYSHVFWLRAQSDMTLTESFLEIATKLQLDDQGAGPEKQVQAVLQWFQITVDPWLLVFDNAESVAITRKFWPPSTRGAIIVTSQNPHLAHITKSEIHLQPMSPEEGCALIQSYLKRGGSEQESAQMLSTSLGGLPLAIAHFSGYVTRSQCPLDQIFHSLKSRIKSSQVWELGDVMPDSAYELTLSTVWTLAFSRLSNDSRLLLQFLAFLNPDQIPVEMFVGPKSGASTAGWQYWEMDRFDAAIGVLLERHLVERYVLPVGDYLRTHRALQRTVLQELDKDLPTRQKVFDEVVAVAREAFPVANILVRGDTSQYEQSAKYMTQVIHIHANFVNSEPEMEKKLLFAQVLSDVGYYGVSNAIQGEAYSLLKTAESICTALLNSQPTEVRPVLGNVLGPLLVLTQYFGVKGRLEALEISTRAIAVREQEQEGNPSDQWTRLDLVNFGRAHNDKGVCFSQLNRIEEASQWFDSARTFYELAGNESTLTSRLGHIYSFQLWPLAYRGNVVEARALGNRSLALIAKAVGIDSPLHLQTKFIVAMTLFTLGFVDEALQLHKEVYEKRLQRQGIRHHLTLGSQYTLAVCYHNTDGFGEAEELLKGILADGCITMQWREEDIVRTKFRLSLVLRAEEKYEEASSLLEQVSNFLTGYRAAESLPMCTDEDDMKLLDFRVSIYHGRTAGIWGSEKSW